LQFRQVGEIGCLTAVPGLASELMSSKCAIDHAGDTAVEPEDQGLRCAPPQSRRILAVEDDDLMLELLSGVLGAERYAVDVAQSCEEALRYALFRDYATILLDLILPDGNGLQLFRQIARRRPAFRERVIFVTGALSRSEARRLSKLVDNPLILKPFRLEDLVTIVQRVAR
jgi:DNA-binding response OmpR family regulator